MATRRTRQSTAEKIVEASLEQVRKNIAHIEDSFDELHKAYMEVEFEASFLRLVAQKDILQLRMGYGQEQDVYVLRQTPIVWLSYEWRDEKGRPSERQPGFRYIEFKWFGVAIRAHFKPTEAWKDREFFFRFAETGASAGFDVKCSLVDTLPPIPSSPYANSDRNARYPVTPRVRTYITALIHIKTMMRTHLDTFRALADKYS